MQVTCPHCFSYAESYPDYSISFEVKQALFGIDADMTVPVERYECQAPDCQKAFYVEKEADND